MKTTRDQISHHGFWIALASLTTATAAGLSTAEASAHNHKFELNVDTSGHLSVAQLRHAHQSAEEEFVNRDGLTEAATTPPIDKLAAALLNFLAQSHELICDMPLSPSQITVTFEVVQVQWSKKVLCQEQTRQILQQTLEHSGGDTRAPNITLRLPKNFLDLSGFKDQFDRQTRLQAFQTFSADLVTFFCRLPVRPDDLSLKVLAAKVKWDISQACKQAL